MQLHRKVRKSNAQRAMWLEGAKVQTDHCDYSAVTSDSDAVIKVQESLVERSRGTDCVAKCLNSSDGRVRMFRGRKKSAGRMYI